MNQFDADVARAAVKTFHCPEPILEIGSYIVPGQEHLSNLRSHFQGKDYTGIDIRPGPGVDAIEDVERLERENDSVGTLFAMNVFEHVKHFWRGFEEIQRVLRPDGLLFVSSPFYFHIHSYPSDYWRFTPEALKVLLQAFPNLVIGYNGPKKRPIQVWAVAAGSDYRKFTVADHDRFRKNVKRHARQPLAWSKRIRYGIGRHLCGRTPFAPFRESEHFDTELVNAA